MRHCGPRRWRIASGAASTSTTARWPDGCRHAPAGERGGRADAGRACRLRPAHRRSAGDRERGHPLRRGRGYCLPHAPLDLSKCRRTCSGRRKASSRMRSGTDAFGMGAQWKGRRAARSRRAGRCRLECDAPAARRCRIAAGQLGTSGTGNHFVEWGAFELDRADAGLEPGEYLALLSHSGSRGVGFKIANFYRRLAHGAASRSRSSVRHLAWLVLDSEAGQEYWLSMELAGRFALGQSRHPRSGGGGGRVKAAAVVENHHNFAWRETLPDGRT